MESQLILKTPSSILFPVTAKNSSFTRVLKCQKSWNGEEKQCTVALRSRRPQRLFTTEVAAVNDNNHAGNFVLKNNRLLANAVPEYYSHQSELAVVPNSLLQSFQRNLDVFCNFARLNVISATALGVISVSLLAAEKMSDISPSFLIGMLSANVAAAFMNIYVIGINHLCDIETDKVNKPDRPLASGDYSVKTGALVVISAAIMSLSIPMFVGSWPLFWALFPGSFVLGFFYSVRLPLLRWKRSPLLTAVCFVVQKNLSQIAYYLHMQTHVLGRPAVFSKSLLFTVAVTFFFALVFGIFKDIPDVAGDKLDDVKSLPIQWGEKKVFMFCVSLLGIAYVGAMLVGATFSNPWSKYLTVIGHATMASILLRRVLSFDYSGPAAYESFHAFIWKIYCVEYVLVQFIR